MTEQTELIPMILAAAVASAGPRGTNEGQWMAKVNDAIPPVAAMMHDASRQWHIAAEVLGAAVFVGTYVDHHVEESSTRVIVRLNTGKPTKNYPDGIEPIRTHRTDGAQGRSMKERLDRLTAGDEIVVWKALEANDDGTEKYRVLVHFAVRPKRTNSPDRGTAVAAAPVGDGRPVEERHARPSGPSTDLTDAVDSDRLNLWREKTIALLGIDGMSDLRASLAEGGYDFNGVSEIEWDEIVRPIIRTMINSKEQ